MDAKSNRRSFDSFAVGELAQDDIRFLSLGITRICGLLRMSAEF
jgi:hypothetical protein